MKVLQIGDMARVAYKLATLLNSNAITTDLLIWKQDLNFKDETWIHHPKMNNKLKNLVMLYYLFRYRNYDVFHAHGIYNLYLLPIYFFKRLSKKTTISHFHGSDIREVATTNTLLGKLIRFCMKNTDFIIVSTIDLVDTLEKMGIKKNKIFFLPNPIDVNLFKMQNVNLNLRISNETIIFSPTFLQPFKKTERLILAFKHLENKYNIVLYLVDGGVKEYNQYIKLLIDKVNITKVKFLPVLETDELIKYYNSCDIVCDQFNDLKMFGQISTEALSCGKPVINSLLDSYAPHFENPPIFKGNNSKQIEQSITYLIENKNQWETIGKNGRIWVNQYYSYESVYKKLMEIYTKIP